VVGFGEQVNDDVLTAIAEQARTDRSGDRAYLLAEDEPGLRDAITEIFTSLIPCSFVLQRVPPVPARLYAFFGEIAAPRDPAHLEGWDYDPARNEVSFYGDACQTVRTGSTPVLVVFGCP
jgi:hypothetical protein